MPRTTKAQLILQEARGRADAAHQEVQAAEQLLDIKRACFTAHMVSLAALESQLTPVTRRPKSSAPAAKKPRQVTPKAEAAPLSVPICMTCGNEETYADHYQPSPNYHKFDSSVRKPKKATPIILPDDPTQYQHAS